jgi:hypothetical protein
MYFITKNCLRDTKPNCSDRTLYCTPYSDNHLEQFECTFCFDTSLLCHLMELEDLQDCQMAAMMHLLDLY